MEGYITRDYNESTRLRANYKNRLYIRTSTMFTPSHLKKKFDTGVYS